MGVIINDPKKRAAYAAFLLQQRLIKDGFDPVEVRKNPDILLPKVHEEWANKQLEHKVHVIQKKERFTAREIIYLVVCNYLKWEEIEKLSNALADIKQDRRFLTMISKYFDIELLKSNKEFWQDVWIYNYLKYDFKGRLGKGKLIMKYEREVLKPKIDRFNCIDWSSS